MKKLTYILSLLAVVLVFSSFTDSMMLDKGKKEKVKTEKVSKKDKKAAKPKKIVSADQTKKVKKVIVEDTITNQVWAFGFSASFTDSIIYMTDIQMLPDVKITKKTKFMDGRADYATQMKRYLEDNLNMTNRTCVLFFEPKKDAAEKKYVEVRKRYSEQTHLTLKYLNSTEFKFIKPEEE